MKEFRFEAAHVLPKHPGKCSQLHGHSWVLRVGVEGLVNAENGFVADFGDLKYLVQPYIDTLDHSFLGAWSVLKSPSPEIHYPGVLDFYPSSENIVLWLVKELQSKNLDKLPSVRTQSGPWEAPRLSLVEIEETCTSRAVWRPQ